ncbi:Peptidase family C25 [Chryseobacterium rhizoplanae]|uniref:Peptidase family C25 n=1 Tax=Chryseobacterium rhizoplanae TaxID=1609531 RepID=A0A521DWW4_9FLAO|nr:type IX secretion system sortase PorU [Chryseobacterium rhizoplanae]SMO76203.1 Peptidase family C25 [Chryseobacterium rhizoplanae]
MKRKITLLSLIAFASTLYAQRNTIEWNGSKIQDFGDTKLNLPNFKNEGFSFSQNNVFIVTKQKIGEKQLKISDLVWENVPAQDLFELDKGRLPDYDVADVSYYNLDGDSYASISVALFKNVKGRVQRLSSFNVSEASSFVNTTGTVNKIGTTANPLSSGNFYKIKVDKSGVFKITSQFLKDNGINPGSINPKNFRIYGNGGVMLPEYNQDARYGALQENAIQVVGEDDGVWNDNDYALFYAQGPDGYNLYDTSNGNGFKRKDTRFSERSNNVKNIYEDYSYYYINFDKGSGKRVPTVDGNLPAQLITRYDSYQVINKDQKNLLKVGRTWVEDTPFSNEKTVTLSTNSPIQAGDVIRYRTQVVAYNSQQNTIDFKINNLNPHPLQTIPTDTSSYQYTFYPVTFTGTLTNLTGNQITMVYNPDISKNPNGTFYFDYVEVQYKENLAFNGSQMNFRDYSIVSGSNTDYGFSITNAANIEQVWDVTDITNANRRVNKAGGGAFNFAYTAADQNFNNEFVAFRADAAFSPQFVGRISNQNLSALQNIDYLILTVPEMMGQAQRLANYHQTAHNYKVEIVDVNKIYEEYGSGSKDLTAVRDFVSKLNTPLGRLQYVFILGDASFDYKNRVPNNSNVVSSYQSEQSSDYVSSFVTDDYIVMTKPQNTLLIENNLPDLPVGRIPAANVSEAGDMINKTLAYYNSLQGQSTPFGDWRMRLDFVVDDNNEGGSPFHNVMDSSLSSIFEQPGQLELKEYNVKKLYMDAFTAQSTSGGRRYPQVNQAISNAIGNSLYLFYFGHGGINGWAQERVLTSTEVQNANNFSNVYSRFPFVSTITCEFTLWDEPATNSVGEQFIKMKQGGASTMITSSRAIGVDYGRDFTNTFTQNIFKLTNDDFNTLGNAHLLAKKQKGPNNNHLKVNFLGDPAMKLSRPQRLLTIDNIETPVPGLIRGLDFVKIKGHINNPNGTLNNTFNGRVSINIFDKRLNKKTLNNTGVLSPVLDYTEEGSAIVKAAGTAVNGVFTAEFYVPKDINYAVGQGRILAYADNKATDVFNNQAVQVGDINPNGINDNQPPKVKLYMNNTNFADGGITNQNPMLLACLTDDTGINATGSGVGHDITTYLDGQIINTVVLNDFYSAGEGNGCLNPSLADYQKGNVTYPFRNLAIGQHQLTFKVWDINNNSTSATLNFEVKDESDQHLTINRPLNWPNPFTNKTYIQFEHNCDDILDVNVQIYTITGRLVRTLSQPVVAEPFLQGFRTPRQAIEWDGRDDFGSTVAKGTYIFKIFAKSQNQEKCKGSATAVEKMVLLK